MMKTRATNGTALAHRAARTAVASLIGLSLTGCATTNDRRLDRQRITAMLDGQAAAWNAGHVEAFMEPYWHSPDLTFSSGGHVTRGWHETLDRYRKRYPTRDAMGTLTFSDVDVRFVDRNAALVLGRWRLSRGEPIGGAFSLVLRRDGGRWTIIHDHTSRDAESPSD